MAGMGRRSTRQGQMLPRGGREKGVVEIVSSFLVLAYRPPEENISSGYGRTTDWVLPLSHTWTSLLLRVTGHHSTAPAQSQTDDRPLLPPSLLLDTHTFGC